jgi:hypothetical protein
MSRIRSTLKQSPAIVISVIALTFSVGGGAGYAASVATAKAPVVKITWHRLGLKGGWKAAAKGFGAAGPQYTVSNGIVYIDGAVSHSEATPFPGESLIGVLPKGTRPSHWLDFEAYNSAANGESSFEIGPNGDVIVGGNGGDQYYFTSLDGLQFPLGA